MSPRVQLVLYPDGDPAFASRAVISVQIDLPDTYSARQVVDGIRAHLRADYPLATIRVEPAVHEDFESTWHVYRDGLPSAIE